MRKSAIMALFLVFIACLALAGCSEDNPTSSNKVYKIGLIQSAEHPSSDDVRKGIVEALKANGFEEGKNITVDCQNAHGDRTVMDNIAKKFIDEKVDLIISISTAATLAAAANTSDIPIVFGAVTDPLAAKLVRSLAKPGTNVTGVSDLNPFDAQFEMLQKVIPNVKKIGIVYNSSGVNSLSQVKEAKQVGSSLGLEILTAPVTNSSEVHEAAQSLADQKIDAFYMIIDNTVAASAYSLSQFAIRNKIPTIAAEDSQVQDGCLISVGIDYRAHGYQTGELAVQVLKGAKPAKTPIEYQKDLKVVINSTTQKALGISIPEEYTKQAAFVQ